MGGRDKDGYGFWYVFLRQGVNIDRDGEFERSGDFELGEKFEWDGELLMVLHYVV